MMPLSFESISHGAIAFGFFNIDSDMLLLDQHFLFGSEFCLHIGEMAENVDKDQFKTNWPVFKQKPEGYLNQAVVREMISGYARQVPLPVAANHQALEVDIGAYKFSRKTFQELIKYVWRGGYPRWRDGIRPDYVLDMKTKIEGRRRGLFERIKFD
jgi:hypothetical protein